MRNKGKMMKIDNATVAKMVGGERLEWADKDFACEFEGKTIEVYLVTDEGSHGREYILCEEEQAILIKDHYTGEEVDFLEYSEYVR